ncbi:aminoglycoside phosphotransferase family protein [Streptomyces sp. NPDC003077]|uniref:aminoglycoside phosphotransferase family protein n=1 Tax=Streptomyces sp. NPDC003077 TaxID=3154443 RepID=UPI00339E6949
MGERRHERDQGPCAVDRGRYEDAVTPWEGPDWRRAALEWAAGELAAHGLRATGLEKVRLRPWSVLVKISVAGTGTPTHTDARPGAVWFKANPPASLFEAGLTEALAGWVPEHVLRPLAVDPGRGWSLLPDGGPLFKDALDHVPDDPRAWEEPLRQYAELQRAVMPQVRAMERLGVPSARTAALPEAFDRLVAGNAVLGADDRAALRALRPRLAEWCAELAGVGIADSLDHGDLHAGQLFAVPSGRFVFFDWGDANVTHPFCSLPVPAQAACDRYGPEVLPRLRDAYLEPWTGDGRTRAELRRAVSLAWRLGAIGRSCSWGRLFPEPSGAPGTAGEAESARWLLDVFTSPPL